jgi:citrate lyase subunit beta/citryl-CoA lyase
MCIHPSQIASVNAVFTPGEEEVRHAERVVAAFERAEQEGSAALQVDGRFIDYPIVYRARAVLARMAEIRAREGER